jgi:hypothetical protein
MFVVVFIPVDNEQTVVGLGPLGVAVDIGLGPGIALGDGAIVHIVIQIRDDKT